MQSIDDGEIDLSAYIDPAIVRVEGEGAALFMYARDPASVEKTYRALKGKSSLLDVYLRSQTPAKWHFRENPRGGDLIAVPKQAAVLVVRRAEQGKEKERRPLPKATHGYDPRKFKTMLAIFYAIGPNVKPKGRVDSFENVNVYPFIARILGLKLPEKLDGSPAVLEQLYRP
jgi:alkaline phosphatase D